jgi:GNAT superfamily N-acetyltransferase
VPPTSVTIARYRPGDLAALDQHVPSPHHPGRAAADDSGSATFLLAWLGDAPVGYLLVKWDGADEGEVRRLIGLCPELNAITVSETHRSRGIGTRLIGAAERLVAARGYPRVGLAVGLGNVRARALYERLGYAAWGHGAFEVSWRVAPGSSIHEHEECIYMLKPLDALT